VLQHVADRRLFQGCWRDIYGLTDEQASALVRQDGIDILIDLAGPHRPGTGSAVRAAKAAPVQASWIGYFNTSGLAAMDYFISDRYSSPGTAPALHRATQSPAHSRFCYLPPDYAPAVRRIPLPRLTAGSLSAASTTWPRSINDVVALWAEILSAAGRQPIAP